MLCDLIEKIAFDMEQLPALGALQVIVVTAVRVPADILIARALPVVEHELAHAPVAQHLFKVAVDRRLSDMAAALAQGVRNILGGQMLAAAVFEQGENQFALRCVLAHKSTSLSLDGKEKFYSAAN